MTQGIVLGILGAPKAIVDLRINGILSIHSQPPKSPNPPYQGGFEDFAPVEIIGKCILISRVYYKSLGLYEFCVDRKIR